MRAIPDNYRPILTADQIENRIHEMAAEISRDLMGESPVFVGVLKGAFIFLADLVRAMSVPVEIDFAQISSYGDETQSSGRIKVMKDITTPVAGRHIVVVEDIIDSGRTLHYYLNELRQRGPASVRLAALINKTERQEYTPKVDYLGFTIPHGFLVGYGLDHAGMWRDLPGVYEVINA
ncbi:MAG: hypoxanthine phosphoribosyltransferase [bacterium]|nr:hypoxanthine phosphoribosyltransferase [bacterium]MDT8367244.1 hypoxanthine phosphoribosyltransferase [bacterium]